MVSNKRYYLKKSALHIFLVLLALVAVNILLSKWIIRIDLTAEKRYTLTKATKGILKDLKEPIVVEVYLEGKDLPAGIKKIKNATKDLLKEFRTYANGNITYTFIDINTIDKEEARELKKKELYQQGLIPINLQVNTDEGYKEKMIFPGAIIRQGKRYIPIQILENQQSYGTQGALDNSVNFLEYKCINAIQKLIQERPINLGFLQGHGEAQPPQMADMLEQLVKQNFYLQRVDLNTDTLLNKNISALIVAKPLNAFSETDKAVIDQYIMHGGKTLWLVDNVVADMDSFKLAPTIYAIPRDLNIDDLLFRYGIRINNDMLLDLYCNPLPIVEQIANNPETRLYPWAFYPIVRSKETHPIVRNLDPVMLRFSSTLDTIKSPGVKKTVLYSSNEYARKQGTPFQIFLEGAKQKPLPELFNYKNIPVAVLLEGSFKSHYANRITTDINDKLISQGNKDILKNSLPTKMIVVADGDVIINDFDQNGSPLPLGYYRYTKQTFANKDFLLNCVQYLTDDYGLIEARNRETKMRLLDKAKLIDQKAFWQVVNVVLPVIMMAIIGLYYNKNRKNKYGK